MSVVTKGTALLGRGSKRDGALFAAVVGYWLGIEVARYVLGFLFLAAGFGAAVAAVTLVQWIGTRGWRPGKG